MDKYQSNPSIERRRYASRCSCKGCPNIPPTPLGLRGCYRSLSNPIVAAPIPPASLSQPAHNTSPVHPSPSLVSPSKLSSPSQSQPQLTHPICHSRCVTCPSWKESADKQKAKEEKYLATHGTACQRCRRNYVDAQVCLRSHNCMSKRAWENAVRRFR